MGIFSQKEAVVHRKPMAFMSYATLDDKHAGGWTTEFCKRLASAVSLRTGQEFEIFQDRYAVQWGQKWQERIEGSLDVSAFLVAMISPAFFRSDWCRKELGKFLGRERELGRSDLVLPVYCVDVPLLHDQARRQKDPLAEAVMARQMEDWRQLRHERFDSPQVRERLDRMARRIAEVAEQLETRVAAAVPGGVAKEPVRGADKARQEEAPLAESKQPALAAGAIRRGDQLAKERQQIAEVAKQLETRVAAAAPGGVRPLPTPISDKTGQKKIPLGESSRSDLIDKEMQRIGKVASGVVLALLLVVTIGLVGGRHFLSDQPKPGDAMREETTGMELVWVPGGCFRMGSDSDSDGHDQDEAPVHEVCVDGLWLGRLETTQAQWERVMGSNPSFFKGPDLPVENVSWDDVQAFVAKLNAKTGGGYRLPTEAEWEHACRAGGSGQYCGGDDLDAVAWHAGNSDGRTHVGGGKAANAFGLHDMSGNVFEWCSDWHDAAYYQQKVRDNPQGPATGRIRVVRGGLWNGYGVFCRSAFRDGLVPAIRDWGLGFRIARGRTSRQAEARLGAPTKQEGMAQGTRPRGTRGQALGLPELRELHATAVGR